MSFLAHLSRTSW